MVTEQGDDVCTQKKGVYAKLCRGEVKFCGMQGVPKGGGAWRLQGLPLQQSPVDIWMKPRDFRRLQMPQGAPDAASRSCSESPYLLP